MKNIKLFFATAVLVSVMSSLAFAGSWRKDSNGWWYMNDDGTYATSGWKWIDGNTDGVSECYYFDNNGYLISDTTIDGHQINSDGAWIVNGVVQTKQPSNVTGTDADWKQAYINYINSGPFEGNDDYSMKSKCWDYAFINQDDIPELICNVNFMNRGILASFFNGRVQEIGGGKETVLYKNGGNLIYLDHYAKGDDIYSYQINPNGFQLIHNIWWYGDRYNVDGNDVSEAQYNIAYEQYFKDSGMMSDGRLWEAVTADYFRQISLPDRAA